MSRLSPSNVRALYYHECGVYNVYINLENILHPRAELGCFYNQNFAEDDAVEFYYTTLIYKTVLEASKERV